jgi:hypothetical protein
MNATIDRLAVEKQIRLEMQVSFDYQPWDVQKSLVDTRIRTLQAQQPAPPAEALVVRERVRPQPQHLPPPPLPKADADEAELRSALREAQRANAEALRKAEQAKVVVARAEEVLYECQTRIACFQELDKQVVGLRIEQFKDGAVEKIPYHIESALAERAKNLDRIEITAKALDRLKAEDKAAEREATLAFERLHYAARDVVVAATCNLLDELIEAEKVVSKLKSLLASCRLIGPPGVPPTQLPAEIMSIVNQEVPKPNENTEFVGVWNDWAQRLRDDADAMPDVELLINGHDA